MTDSTDRAQHHASSGQYDLIDELSDANDKADNHFIERLYAHHHIWGKVGTKVGTMINDTLFTALDLEQS